MGGYGADTMIGELSESHYNTKEANLSTDNDGDNDYFFIDTNLSNNANNVDRIKNFYVAGSDSTADDWLVFSAQQLGVGTSDLSGLAREQIPVYFNDIPLSIGGVTPGELLLSPRIWKEGLTENDLNGYRLPIESLVISIDEERFFKVNGIENYKAGSTYLNDSDSVLGIETDASDSLFAFVLDTARGDLYFDFDGNKDYDDAVKVAHIDVHPSGDDLSDMHLNQIIILQNFDLV